MGKVMCMYLDMRTYKLWLNNFPVRPVLYKRRVCKILFTISDSLNNIVS